MNFSFSIESSEVLEEKEIFPLILINVTSLCAPV